MATRKYIAVFISCLIGVFAGKANTTGAVTISSSQIYCIAVDSAGNATVTWQIPNNLDATFLSYNIDTSLNPTTNFASAAKVTNPAQNSVYITGLGANKGPVYFSEYVSTTNGNSDSLGVVESIFLTVTPHGPGVAQLNWNAMSNPNPPGFDGWYKVYREYNHVWTLVDSTNTLTYTDTIHYCHDTLKYKIVEDNSAGCESVSNIAGGFFSEIFPPKVTYLDTVSVGPGGNVSISWYPSSAQNVKGYLVYMDSSGIWVVIDTAKGINTTYYNYTKGSPGSGSISFRVAPIDSCDIIGVLDSTQNTIYLTEVSNQCNQTNTLHWTPFVDMIPGGIAYYEIYISTNSGPFQWMADTTALTYIQSGLSHQETFCYFVRAISASNPDITASSNIICYTVTVPPPPAFDYLRSATVINNSTQDQVNWYVDTGANITEYIVERSDVPGGKATNVGSVPATTSLYYSFVDPSANPNLESYTYTVYAKDACDFITDSTNMGQTMFLTAVGDNTGKNTLNWNAYQDWNNGVSKYNIYRDQDYGPFTQIGTIASSPGSETFTDDVSAIITGEGIFGYYVQAVEQGPNGYPFIADTANSNIAEAYQDPRMYIPNAFDPNGVNKIFKPVGVFVDIQNYDFTIFNRWGQLIFETTDVNSGWDGHYMGPLVEEGVYIYHIQYTSSKGEYFNQRGWVMMLK